MKKAPILILSAFLLLFFNIPSIGQNLKEALSDIENGKVTLSTISKLETASQNSGDEVESLYNLARIYHFNPQFSDITKARTYYSRVQSMYHMGDYSKQVGNLNKKYGVDKRSVDNTINGIDELICNNAFMDAVKTNTFDGYVNYVTNYPNSKQVNTAKDKALEVTKARQNTIEGYSHYMSTFPEYRTEEVKQLALNAAKATNTYEGYQELAKAVPGYNTNEVNQLALKAAIAKNMYSTQAEFKSHFPNECATITRTIDFMGSQQLDSRGQSILRSLKIEYINSSNDLSSLAAAIKRYPIVTFNYDEKYYESQQTYDNLIAQLNRMGSDLSNSLKQKLINEAETRKDQFVNDWKGSPSKGRKVADSYPDMYKTIEDGLYAPIASMSIGTRKYESASQGYEMDNELGSLNSNINYCNEFINNFGNSKYIKDVKAKRDDLNNRKSYVSKCNYDFVQHKEYVKRRIDQIKYDIIENGRTPSYSLEGWESQGFITTWNYRAKGRVEFDVYGYDLSIYVYSDTDRRHYNGEVPSYGGPYRSYSYPRSSRDFSSKDKVIRYLVWGYYYESLAEYGDEKLLEYLESNKNGRWWGYIFK